MTSGRSPWPDPEPAERVWMQGAAIVPPKVGAAPDVAARLHRVQQWDRAPSGRIYARCGASSVLWIEPHPGKLDGFTRCLGCEDADDAR